MKLLPPPPRWVLDARRWKSVVVGSLVAELGKDGIALDGLGGLGRLSHLRLLGVVEDGIGGLPLGLQALDGRGLVPAALVRDAAEHTEAAAHLQASDAESVGHDHALHFVIGLRDAVEALQALHGALATVGLVRDLKEEGASDGVRGGMRRRGRDATKGEGGYAHTNV